MLCIYNQTIKIKNGMPFYYYNGTEYFMPPGQMKNNNSTHVPPGLAKKGYVKPVPTINNGSLTWPWDEINYTYIHGNKTMPTMRPMPTITPMKHGNGNGNGNGNGQH